jgi:hypothetical protein
MDTYKKQNVHLRNNMNEYHVLTLAENHEYHVLTLAENLCDIYCINPPLYRRT